MALVRLPSGYKPVGWLGCSCLSQQCSAPCLFTTGLCCTVLAWSLYSYLTVQSMTWQAAAAQALFEVCFLWAGETLLAPWAGPAAACTAVRCMSTGRAVVLALAGSAAIQIAKVIGAKIFVTASSAEKLAFCQKLGADVLINYRKQDFADIVMKEANPDATLQVGCCRCATTGRLCRMHEIPDFRVSCSPESVLLHAAQTVPTCLMQPL